MEASMGIDVAEIASETESFVVPEFDLEPINPDAVVIKPIRHVRSQSDCTGILSTLSSSSLLSSESTTHYRSVDDLTTPKTKPRFLDDGGSSIILPSAGEDYPVRRAGQSVEDYLLANINSSTTRAELDRENSHFTVSETMIAAIEETLFVAWQQKNLINEDIKERGNPETGTTEKMLPRLMSSLRLKKPKAARRIFPIECDEQVNESAEQCTNLQSARDSGVSFSITSLSSTVDEDSVIEEERSLSVASADPGSTAFVSAEAIALSLLEQFSEIHLPRLNDLEWLVSEEDAPQHLLPMPKSWPISPDAGASSSGERGLSEDKLTPLRGNWEWAPPRPQVVFAIYNSPNLKVLIAKQNYRCAGCGVKVRPEYCKSFRFCNYFGRYFCTSCHSNKSFFIPSRILKKWDFKKYPVSNFSMEVLERLWGDPLFNINYASPYLYRRHQQLNKVKELRIQLCHLADYLRLCRFAQSLWDEVQHCCGPWLDEPHTYSLHDLVRVKTGDFYPHLRPFVLKAMEHVIQCQLCRARGFFCEICKSQEVIFPFQLDLVTRCDKCGSCHHTVCLQGVCPRCQRKAKRSDSLQDAESIE